MLHATKLTVGLLFICKETYAMLFSNISIKDEQRAQISKNVRSMKTSVNLDK